jgi:hypothetical protein
LDEAFANHAADTFRTTCDEDDFALVAVSRMFSGKKQAYFDIEEGCVVHFFGIN